MLGKANAQTKLKKSIFNGTSTFIGVVVSVALGLLIPRLVLVNYGSQTNGLVNSVNQFVAYLALFESGIGLTANQALYKPVSENDHEDINSVMAALHRNYKKVGGIYLICLLLLSVLYPVLVSASTVGMSFWEIFLIVFFSGFGNVILFFFQGKYRVLLQVEGKNYILSNLQTVITTLIAVAKIILLLNGLNIVFVIIATFLLNLIQAVYILVMIKTKYKWLDVKVDPSPVALSKKKYVFIHQIAWMVFQNTDVLLLTVFCDLRIVSVYALYKMVISHLQSVLNIPYDSMNFMLGQMYSADIDEFKKRIDCVEIFHSALCFSVFTVTMCLFTPFITLYTSGVNDVNYIDKYLPCLFVVIELLIFARKPMLNTINYAGHFKETLLPTIIETVLNLTVSIVGVVRFGIYGVLLGTVLALVYRTIDVIVYANVKLLNRSFWKTLSIYIVDFVIFAVIVCLYTSLSIEISSYAWVAVVGTVLLIAVAVTYFVLHAIIYRNDCRYFVGYIKHRLIKHRNP